MGDLPDMCNSRKKYSRVEVYEAIQATVACIQKGGTTRWVFKVEGDDDALCFDMSPEIDLAVKYKIKLIELGGESVLKIVNMFRDIITKMIISTFIIYFSSKSNLSTQ
jgi:hypothetical protein